MKKSKPKRTHSPAQESKRYTWHNVSRFSSRLDAQVVGEELERVRQSYGTHVTAEQVVEAADDLNSPLHEAFPWDDAEAAREHRLEIARLLLRSVRTVRVVIIGGERKETECREFVSTPAKKPGTRHYTTTEYAMGDPELRAHVLRQVLLELAAYRRKYAEFSELAIVFAAIDKVRKEVA
jgi:hypothetical protein